MKCFNCKNELIKLKENWWVCPGCKNQYPTGTFSPEDSDNQIQKID